MPKPAPMRVSDAVVLLAAAAAVDNRIVSESTAQEWAYALAGYELGECLEALRRFRRETVGVYLEPGHIRQRVKAARDEQWARSAWKRGLPAAPPASRKSVEEARATVEQMLAKRRSARAESNEVPPEIEHPDNRQREAPTE